METPRFDGLTKALASGRLSRRSALGRLGQGGVVATGLTALGLGARQTAAQDTDDTGIATATATAGSDDVVVPGTTRDALPAVDPETTGRLRYLTDDDRGLWLETDAQWVSLRGEVFDVRAYGAVGDGVTDDWGAFNLAIEAMTSALDADSTSAYGRTLYVPPGTYRLAQTLVLDRSVRLVGASGAGHNTDSILQVDEGIVGILVAAADPGLTGQPGRRGEGVVIERLRVRSAAPPLFDATETDSMKMPEVAADPAAIHGIWLRVGASVRDVCVERFSGDGIHVQIGGDGASVTEGGADPAAIAPWEVSATWIAGCGGSGLVVEGSGGGLAELVTASANAGWGFRDESDGTAFVRCRTAGNASGSFTSVGGANRSLFLGCLAADDQPRAVFNDRSLVVAGVYPDGYAGGNAWTADASRMFLQAQTPGTGEARLPTVPTLHLRAAGGQVQAHVLVGDRRGGRLVEVDAAGRLLVGPADLTPPVGGGDAAGLQPVQVQISHPESGQAALRWVVGGEAAAWVAQARAYLEAGGTDSNPDAGAARLTFQTAGTTTQEVDTLTLRDGRVGIGTVAPAPAAVLEVSSATQGFLPPRMTSVQRDAIAAPPEGLTIFNVTTKRLNVHDSEQWREVAFTEPEAPAVGG